MSNKNECKDVMLSTSLFPIVQHDEMLVDVIQKMTDSKIGIAVVNDGTGKVLGIITDGDLRRIMITADKQFTYKLSEDIKNYTNSDFISCSPNDLISKVIRIMDENLIWDIPVIKDGVAVGLVHLHPIVKYLIIEN